jgi:maltoporin
MDSPFPWPGIRGLKYTLVAGLTLLTTDALFAQSADQNDMDALKAQMNQMQRQYEQRIEAMEAKMKALESNANSGSILNTRVLTDADGKEMPGKAQPMLDESFLKSLTRNFTFNVYMRAGFQFNGNGGGGNFNFEVPDGDGGRFRLGNENDFYTELSLNQAHILGDSPDVADVSFRATLVYQNEITRQNFTVGGNNFTAGGIGYDEAFVEMKNVFKSAPEITFWGGNRFYDRWNFDPNDWFWLNTSGFGVGAYNINIGPGNLYVAWLGSELDNLNLTANPNQINDIGNQFMQTFDVRYRNIDIGFGKLNLIAIGNYVKGGTITPNGGTTFTDITGVSRDINVQTSDQWGIGGGLIWEYDFGNKSYLRLFGLAGWGATNFGSTPSFNAIAALENQVNRSLVGVGSRDIHFAADGTVTGSINPVSNTHTFRAGWEYVWNPTSKFAMDFWGYWDQNNQGYALVGENAAGDIKVSNPTRNLYGVGLRPVFWLVDNFAIQGSAGYNYVDNVRGYSGTNAFGRSGGIGVFSIAPTLKPVGGYFTRPEIRVFATWSIWSNSLKGATTPVGEGGNFGTTTNFAGFPQANGSTPPYNSNTNQGWLFGSQMEIWF